MRHEFSRQSPIHWFEHRNLLRPDRLNIISVYAPRQNLLGPVGYELRPVVEPKEFAQTSKLLPSRRCVLAARGLRFVESPRMCAGQW